MTPYEIHPFYFPTTVVFVDDNADFLANLGLQLDSRLAFRMFRSPIDALIALNGNAAGPPPVRGFFAPYRDREDDDLSLHVIDISLKIIHREVYNEKRFEQVSVVVVDFEMPEIDGLEFCRSIKNPLVRKILLTGEADERTAVKAFNKGVIDRFIRKQDAEAMTSLNQAIGDMQQLYFGRLEQMLSDVLSVGHPRFLQDNKFAERFRQIRKNLGIVEYYLTCLPDGMLMLDARGAPYLLIVRNEVDIRDDHDIAYDQAAPAELLEALRSGRVVPYFWKTEGYYTPIYRDNWRTCLHPATEFHGNDWYLYAIVKEPAAFNLEYVLSYGEYLDQLDEAERGSGG